MNKYPNYIMRRLRESYGYDENDVSNDKIFEDMSKNSVVMNCLEWEGIIGYTDWILSLIEDVYDIKFKD